jgi:hypothetical protein
MHQCIRGKQAEPSPLEEVADNDKHCYQHHSSEKAPLQLQPHVLADGGNSTQQPGPCAASTQTTR